MPLFTAAAQRNEAIPVAYAMEGASERLPTQRLHRAYKNTKPSVELG